MSSTILRDGELVADDWMMPDDERADVGSASVSASGSVSGATSGTVSGPKVIVTLARWREGRPALAAAHAHVGVLVPNSTDIEAIYPEIRDRPLIALQFPTFSDGRALSQAVVLRKRLGFRGELRATGDVIRDLVFWLARCGFDSIAPRKDQNLDACRTAIHELTVAYQAAADGHTPVWIRRRGGLCARNVASSGVVD